MYAPERECSYYLSVALSCVTDHRYHAVNKYYEYAAYNMILISISTDKSIDIEKVTESENYSLYRTL